jgi:hypothetical protein
LTKITWQTTPPPRTGKNRTPEPSHQPAETFIHIGFRPFWQGGKLFEGRNFGDKKIFFPLCRGENPRTEQNPKKALQQNCVNLRL